MTRITLGGAVLRGTVSTALMVSLMSRRRWVRRRSMSKWSPDYVRSIAGTQDFDTAADCGKVTRSTTRGD
jgi:multiple sugar transport system substrate-binding protein